MVPALTAKKTVRAVFSSFLSSRSILRHHKHPTRENTWQSLIFVLVSIPFALIAFPVLLIRRIFRQPVHVTVLATEGEFGPFMNLMEFMRGEPRKPREILFVLAKKRHVTFAGIYRREINRPIFWSNGVSGFFQQAVLLQPSLLVVAKRLTPVVANRMPTHPVRVDPELEKMRTQLLTQLGCNSTKLVAMAVHTTQYDDEANGRYASKEASRESKGAELAVAIDYLSGQNVDVVLLGAADTRASRIPRDIPRLSDFGQHGGPQEVAIASGCTYFWTDDVGAWWLAVPFGKPVLFTNFTRILIRRGVQPRGHLVVPARYETLDGRRLTFEEILATRSPTYKAASRGELRLIRNSPEELLEGHREMISRLDGTWKEDDESRDLRVRLEKIFSRYEEWHPLNVSSFFLKRHPYLLD